MAIPQMDMATALQITTQLHQAADQLIEPVRGAMKYAGQVAHDPMMDKTVCEQAGKVVRLLARMEKPVVHPITLRGNLGPLSWENDFMDDRRSANENYVRTFTFHIPPEQMEKTLEFKICQKVQQGKTEWSAGPNLVQDLSVLGHHVNIKVENIAF